jgi:hypothetical protein
MLTREVIFYFLAAFTWGRQQGSTGERERKRERERERERE